MTDPRPGVPVAEWITPTTSSAEIGELTQFLESQGTFRFPTISSGLFSAAAADNPDFRLTGYQNIWTRDNCHISHALWVTGQKELAGRAVQALLQFYTKYKHKFADIIEDRADPSEPMNRPHVRFDGERMEELDVRWSHAQNDALGAMLWISCKLLRSKDLATNPAYAELFDLVVRYFATIEFWQDEDSGYWEETRKIEASSIGTVIAGLTELRGLLAEKPTDEVDLKLLNDLIARGRRALLKILPAECIQDDPKKKRRYDASLLFLIYPLNVIDDALASQIIKDVRDNLTGEIGIRRYNGDSYWCADYRDLLAPEVRTTDFSEDMSARDMLLQPGQEAQWCIFDPILSVIHARRWKATGDEEERALQIHHLRRSLLQLTDAEDRFAPYRCPESYFLEHGEWIPNDICPLLWTQGNLKLALHFAR